MAISDTSRYLMTLGATRVSDGLTYLLDREPLRFQPRSDNKRVVARAGDTWWSLASEHLAALTNPEQLFWVICDYQPMPVLDSTVDPTPGTIVYIPDEDFVMSYYFADSRREQDTI
jgi:hypothetical protein